MATTNRLLSCALVLPVGLLAIAVRSAPLEVSRVTFGGSGVTRGQSGNVELAFSFGASNSGLLGGNYEITIGSWLAGPPGDLDQDGLTTLMDFPPFESCMTGPMESSGAQCQFFDLNLTGEVDLADFAVIQNVISNR